ncbi:DMT family transporter [Vallitalea guaymasensis]|uniref:DMT family transporter n=1 Tax=Vallitalea guaymasensis TaxID=1185412 RepID=A0A8J8MDF7_9FIRM|nr:DMT family transporter [Vallitalea guaymasensis]QUH30916.1 DMT family transporter [Vallitalea guaymasensis]
MYIILALLAGALVIVSISINGNLATKVGLIQSSITNYLVGLISSIIFFLILNRFVFDFSFNKLGDTPFYYMLGGVIGSIIICLNNLLINKISAVYVTILIFLGQMITGILIDYAKSGIFSTGKVIGGLLIVIGLVYYIFGDKKAKEIAKIK